MYKDIEKILQTPSDVAELFESHGYPLIDFNLFGVRRKELDRVNVFEDAIGALYWDDGMEDFRLMLFKGTTVPGLSWLGKKMGNKNGTWILAPGYYPEAFVKRKHNGRYNAFCQNAGEKLYGYRDKDKDGKIDLSGDLYDDVGGCNLHTTSWYNTILKVGLYSAGCQVVQLSQDFVKLRDIGYSYDYPVYPYALFEEENL